MSGLQIVTKEMATRQALDEAFPPVRVDFQPFGGRILVQIRRAAARTKSGFYLPSEAKDAERWNASVGKVIAIGPLAFKKRDTMESWPEGVWAAVGDYVRAPRYGGDRWEVEALDGSEDKVLLAVFNDHELIGRIEGDPLEMRGYV